MSRGFAPPLPMNSETYGARNSGLYSLSAPCKRHVSSERCLIDPRARRCARLRPVTRAPSASAKRCRVCLVRMKIPVRPPARSWPGGWDARGVRQWRSLHVRQRPSLANIACRAGGRAALCRWLLAGLPGGADAADVGLGEPRLRVALTAHPSSRGADRPPGLRARPRHPLLDAADDRGGHSVVHCDLCVGTRLSMDGGSLPRSCQLKYPSDFCSLDPSGSLCGDTWALYYWQGRATGPRPRTYGR